jgi:hypothetical protein
MAAWVHRTFPTTGCALAIEIKKTFMDEWSGRVDDAHLAELFQALEATLPGLVESLGHMTEAVSAISALSTWSASGSAREVGAAETSRRRTPAHRSRGAFLCSIGRPSTARIPEPPSSCEAGLLL